MKKILMVMSIMMLSFTVTYAGGPWWTQTNQNVQQHTPFTMPERIATIASILAVFGCWCMIAGKWGKKPLIAAIIAVGISIATVVCCYALDKISGVYFGQCAFCILVFGICVGFALREVFRAELNTEEPSA